MLKSLLVNIVKLKPTMASSLQLLAVVGLFYSCVPNQPETIKALTNAEELPSLHVFDLTTTVTDSGRVSYRFVTPEMANFDHREKPTIEFPRGLHLFIHGDNEEIKAQVKCNKAVYYQAEELWELRNNVEAVNVNGDVINTELLFWDRKRQRIYSDQFIKITTSTEIITGYGFEADEQLQNYKIRNISGVLHLNEQEAAPVNR